MHPKGPAPHVCVVRYDCVMGPRRPVRVALGIGAIVVLGSVTLAGAPATSAAETDRSPVPRTVVKTSGLRVSWPSSADRTRLAPGSILAVRVQRTAKAKRTVRARITVTRLARGVTKRRVVRRATVRRGTTSIKVSRKVGTRYRLAVRIGARTWRSTIKVGGPFAPTAPSTPEACVPAGHLEAPTSATVGSRVPLAVVNTGTAILAFGAATGRERLVASGWVPVQPPLGLAYPMWLRSTRPGATGEHGGTIWATMEPGTYRITLPVTATCGQDGGAATPAEQPAITLHSGPIAVTSN